MNNESDGDVITDATHIFAPVFHKVEAGETVQSIIQQFGMNKYQFDRWNSLPDGLKPGANVVVKYRWYKRTEFDVSLLQDKTKPQPLSSTGGNVIYHRVAAHETLYQLSSLYHVPVEQLKTWNNLSDNNIKANINLIVGK